MKNAPQPSPTQPATFAKLRELVLSRGEIRTFRPNTVVAQEGEPAESLYWIVSGELSAFVEDEEGKALELTRMGPDDYFGELIFAGAVRTASVRTVTAARLCRISHAELAELLLQEPQIGLEIIRKLSTRLARLTRTVRGIALADVYSRLRALLEDAVPLPDGTRRVEGVSQQAIAERIGASKSMVNRLLKDLEAGGHIAIRRKGIEVLSTLPRRW